MRKIVAVTLTTSDGETVTLQGEGTYRVVHDSRYDPTRKAHRPHVCGQPPRGEKCWAVAHLRIGAPAPASGR